MGRPKEPLPAKLFMSIIAKEDDYFNKGMKELEGTFGEIDFVSERFAFNLTEYYTEEMGKDLFRHFITFKRLIDRSMLPEIKLITNRIENEFANSNGNRRINVDPGYICLEHVILATTKGYSHRPYMRDGIYADLTLIYKNKSFRAMEWTYPDYRQEEIIKLFNLFRSQYLEVLREGKYLQC